MQAEKSGLKERVLKINLTDEEVEQISQKAGSVNLTVSELLENFIADLVGSSRRNGSDECDRADDWFERCWFSMFPEDTFLRFMLTECYSISDFVTTYSTLCSCEEDINEATEDDEIKDIQAEIDALREELEESVNEYRSRNQQAKETLETYAGQLERWMMKKSDLKYGSPKEKRMRFNPLVNIEISLYFKICNSVMFGGAGTEGYMALVFDGTGELEQFSDEHLEKHIRDISKLCNVPESNVIMISKAEYDLATGDSEESLDE